MIDGHELVLLFNRNFMTLEMQLDGITHQDSLIQLPFRGNCLNWVLGHIVATRTPIFRYLGAEPVWDENERARYKFGSDPIEKDGDDIYHFEKIVADLNESQQRLIPALEHIALDDLNQVIDDEGWTRGNKIAYLAWHEGYHVGQTEYLRQLAGKDDKVI